MNTNKQEKGDLSMLDLFRLEVETQTVILNKGLLALKAEPNSVSILEDLSRAINAIRGVARIVDLDVAINLAEIIKNYFECAYQKQLILDANSINILLNGVDIISSLSQQDENNLETWLLEKNQQIETVKNYIISLIGDEKIEPEIKIKDREKPTIQNPTSETQTLINPSMLDLFRLEVEAQANILNQGLLALESQPKSPKVLESLMRAAHSVKGAARIVAVDAAVNLAHVMEDCFVAAQNQTILLGADQIDILLHGVDLLLNISQIENNHLNTWLLEQGHEMELTYQQITTILDSGQVFTQLIPLKTEVLEVRNPPNLTSENQNLTAIVPETQNLKLEIQPPKSEPSDRVVRVSADNLNRIMGLAGESLIESNWLQPFADSLTILKKRHLELSKIMENLQESLVVGQSGQKNQTQLEAARAKERECREILGERLNELELYARRTANLSDRLYREVIASHMRPFADGVQGFPRMIRDLARKLGKQVKLEILGKATPVDRDILKKLESPLTHILRNSVDHGFEIPEERLSAGKTAEGTLRLEAVHRGGMLSITISDDGKGIDIEQLRKKVINKNLATPEIAAQLTESELIEFLFLPGFSTAKQVTEISGRGVGLDIARSMAQEVGGTVRGSSQLGKGMIFHFQLPLTLSVVRNI